MAIERICTYEELLKREVQLASVLGAILMVVHVNIFPTRSHIHDSCKCNESIICIIILK